MEINIKEKLLENAISSIEMGIEDYQASSSNSQRLLSCVRNCYAGMLLLLKCKLIDISGCDDSTILKNKVLPIVKKGKILWIGDERDKRTIDYQDIKERFNSLGLEAPWQSIESLRKYRNNIEHYFNVEEKTIETVKQYVVSCFSAACDYLIEQLKVSPRKCFSENAWNVFISTNDLIKKELKERDSEYDELIWFDDEIKEQVKQFTCPECGGSLLFVDKKGRGRKAHLSTFICGNCREKFSYKSVIIDIVGILYGGDVFIGEHTFRFITQCSKCGQNTYDAVMDLCFLCGNNNPLQCNCCGKRIELPEVYDYSQNGICNDCLLKSKTEGIIQPKREQK